MGHSSLRKIPRVPEGRRIELQIQTFPLLVWPPHVLVIDRELKTGSRRLIITYTQRARPRLCFIFICLVFDIVHLLHAFLFVWIMLFKMQARRFSWFPATVAVKSELIIHLPSNGFPFLSI